MATVQVKNKGKPETDEILQHIKQLQATVNEIQTSMNKLVKKHIDMKSITPTIAAAFDDADFIKQICYENDTTCDVIKLIVIFEHDDFSFGVNTIARRFGKLQDQLSDVDMELLFFQTSEVEPSRLDNTTTVFKRE